ncbi:hypothetical protein H7Y40_01315, partial [Pedobacter sp.]|nr:hypothetical protein [Candidatus Saccharibacteria bacterium]
MERSSTPRDILFEQLGVDAGISTAGMIERIAELRADQRHWGETQEEFAKAGVLSAMLNDLRAYDVSPEASGFYNNCLSPIMSLSQGDSVVLSGSSIKEIDTDLYKSALEVVQVKDEPAHIKDAFVAASLYFAFETPHGVQKVERVLGDLMSAMQQAQDKRSTFAKRSSARGQVQAINAYLEMSGLAPNIVYSPSQLSQLAAFGRQEVK